MNNNDIIRRIRYIFDYSDSKMIEIFKHVEFPVSREQIIIWLKKDDDPEYQLIRDKEMAIFLDGFIIEKRGRKNDDPIKHEKKLNNNIIFRKLKIALALKDDDILDIMKLADLRLSKHELSAFFRSPEQSQYRDCKDQFLRNFLQGLQIKIHGENKM